MENETFLSDSVVAIFEKYTDRKQQLHALASFLKKNYDIRVYFCEIIGSRWSFVAGDNTLDIPEHRIKINKNYGMMTGEILCSSNQWIKIVELLCEKWIDAEA